MIFLDGFRWDYVSCINIKSPLKGFTRLKDVGASIERVKPVFPADCFPNFYSIFSGHYPKEHGFLFNDLYNDYNGDAFSHESNSSSVHIKKWLKVDLIWNQLAQRNYKSKIYHLPICSNSDETRISCIPYERSKMNLKDFKINIFEALNGLTHGDINFSIVYNDILDKAGHLHGPMSSSILNGYIPKIDEILVELINHLDALDDKNIHLVIASDHGLAESTEKSPIHIENVLIGKRFKNFLNRGTSMSIWSNPKDIDNIQRELINRQLPVTFYNSTTLPESWRVDSLENLFPNLYVMANPGYLFETKILRKFLPNIKSLDERKGWHGYSPDHHEMHTPFFIYGSRVRPGLRVQYSNPIEVIHIYHLLMKVLIGDDVDSIGPHYNDHLPRSLLKSPFDDAINQKANYPILSMITSLKLDETIKITTRNFYLISSLLFLVGSLVGLCISHLYNHFYRGSFSMKFMKVPCKTDGHNDKDEMKIPFIFHDQTADNYHQHQQQQGDEKSEMEIAK